MEQNQQTTKSSNTDNNATNQNQNKNKNKNKNDTNANTDVNNDETTTNNETTKSRKFEDLSEEEQKMLFENYRTKLAEEERNIETRSNLLLCRLQCENSESNLINGLRDADILLRTFPLSVQVLCYLPFFSSNFCFVFVFFFVFAFLETFA